MIEMGNVSLDGDVVTKAGTKAGSGSVVQINLVDESDDQLIAEGLPLDILYEDEQVIVLNKKAGQVVHPGAGNSSGTLVNALLAHFPDIRAVGETDRPGVVHRIDKDTSGTLIFAKTQKAYKWLVRQFKTRELNKTYLALVDGKPPTPSGRIETPIVRDTKVRTRMAVGLRDQAKDAITEYFSLESFESHTLLEVHPITGRTHQIRVHLSYIGSPIVGDTLYGRRHPSLDVDRFFLHAQSLSVVLPNERVPRHFEAPLPDDLQRVLDQLHLEGRQTG